MDNPDYLEQREELLQDIANDREEVRVALHELTDATGHKLDVSDRIRSSPLAWAVGAFLIGVWLGGRREA
jgi:hypothetical protein